MPPTDTDTQQQKKDTPNSAKQPTGTPPAPQAAVPKSQPPKEPPKHPMQVPIGIVGEKLEQVERQVPETDAPPLPTNDKLAVLGQRVPRLDGRLKVTGAAKYTADINLPGMLFARMITAAIPHGSIKNMDASAAETAPGVRAIHVLNRDRGAAQQKGEETQKFPRVRYVGQPIAAGPGEQFQFEVVEHPHSDGAHCDDVKRSDPVLRRRTPFSAGVGADDRDVAVMEPGEA